MKKVLAQVASLMCVFTIAVFNEGICFFLFHQPPFPEKVRKVREEVNGEVSKDTY